MGKLDEPHPVVTVPSPDSDSLSPEEQKRRRQFLEKEVTKSRERVSQTCGRFLPCTSVPHAHTK